MRLTRSENMARIRAGDTEPELQLRCALWKRGLRYRVNYRTPGGRADFALPARGVAIFVDGCFWHGCPEHYVRPRSASAFWERKLLENVSRDRRQTQQLLDAGWIPIRLWEHEVREDLEGAASGVFTILKTGRPHWPIWRVVRVEAVDAATRLERRRLEELLGSGCRVEEGQRITAKVGRVYRLRAPDK